MFIVDQSLITPDIVQRGLSGLSGTVTPLGDVGGFKKTFRAEWNGVTVAVQVHHSYDPDRYARETDALIRVCSPNVAKLLHETELRIEDASVPLYVCEFIQGHTLARHISESGPLSGHDLRRLGDGLLMGLTAIHASSLIHRDLKPENVMIRPNGEPVILDLGIARHMTKTTITALGRHPGTPGWMAPEQWHGMLPVDYRCDLFAVGLILSYSMTGLHPFPGADGQAIQESMCEDPPTFLPLTDPNLRAVITRLLNPKPYLRHRNISQLWDDWTRWRPQ